MAATTGGRATGGANGAWAVSMPRSIAGVTSCGSRSPWVRWPGFCAAPSSASWTQRSIATCRYL